MRSAKASGWEGEDTHLHLPQVQRALHYLAKEGDSTDVIVSWCFAKIPRLASTLISPS